MSCIECDARLQAKLDFWNGAKREDNPFYKPGEDMISLAHEAWDAEWDSLNGKADLHADFFILRTQQEALKSLLNHPPLTKGKLIKQLLAVLSK